MKNQSNVVRINSLYASYFEQNMHNVNELEIKPSLLRIKGRSPNYFFQFYDENDKRVSPKSTKTSVEADALLFAQDHIQKKLILLIRDRGFTYLEGAVTIGTICDIYIDDCKKTGNAASTIDEYAQTRDHLVSTFGDLPIEKFTKQHCRKFQEGWINKKGKFITWNIGGHTLAKHIRQARAMWEFSNDLLPRNENPWSTLRKQRVITTQKQSPSRTEFANIMECIGNLTFADRRLKRILLLLSIFGFRIQELFHLDKQQISSEEGVIRLSNKDLTEFNGYRHVTKPKKPRNILLTSTANKIIDEQLQDNSKEGITTSLIFGDPDGKKPNYNALRNLMNSFFADRFQKRWTFHDLRRFCATMMYLNGVPIEAIQLQMGHSTIAQTIAYITVPLNALPQARVSQEEIDRVAYLNYRMSQRTIIARLFQAYGGTYSLDLTN